MPRNRNSTFSSASTTHLFCVKLVIAWASVLRRLHLGEVGAEQRAGGDEQHHDGRLHAALEHGLAELLQSSSR